VWPQFENLTGDLNAPPRSDVTPQPVYSTLMLAYGFEVSYSLQLH